MAAFGCLGGKLENALSGLLELQTGSALPSQDNFPALETISGTRVETCLCLVAARSCSSQADSLVSETGQPPLLVGLPTGNDLAQKVAVFDLGV